MKIANKNNLALLMVGAWLSGIGMVRADALSWANPVDGTWDATTISNWYNDTTGAAATAVPGTNDDVTITTGVTVTLPAVNPPPQVNSLTVTSGATFFINGGNRVAVANGIFNTGLMLFSGGWRPFAQFANGTGTLSVTNTGTIAAENSGSLSFSGSVNNTNGLIDLRQGGAFDARGFVGISGGSLNIAATASFNHTDVQSIGSGLNLTDVTINNAGMFDWASNTTGGSRTKNMIITDGSFANTGTVNLLQQGDVDSTGNNYIRNLNLQISGGNVFTNGGRILVQNITPDSESNNEYAQLTVSHGADGSFTNESDGLIVIRNAATGDTINNGAQYARLTVNSPDSFTNSGTIAINLDSAVTDDAGHYATLLINGDWSNTGVITVDGANKTLATASLDLSGKAYTQSAAAAVTRLANGGQLRAATVNITSGTLAGSGNVLAATIIGGGATLDPDGVLTLSNLTLSTGSLLEFTLGTDSDLLQINGALTLDGLLNITAGTGFGAGQYLLANYTGSLTDNGLGVNNTPGGYSYELDYSANGEVYLNVIAIPEPSAATLLAVGALLVGLLRARRHLF
jgi:hypothetical protein